MRLTDDVYYSELRTLEKTFFYLGEICHEQIMNLVTVMRKPKKEGLNINALVQDKEHTVNILTRNIEHQGIRLLALRQPKAIDLRQVIAIMRAAQDWERIGDLCAGSSKRFYDIANIIEKWSSVVNEIIEMARKVAQNAKKINTAFQKRDILVAKIVRKSDKGVNTLFENICEIITEKADHTTCTPQLLMITRNMERIGDHISRIGLQVRFLIKGEGRLKESEEEITPPFI